GVTGKDEQVVRGTEVRGSERLEVLVRVHVDLLAGLRQPMLEAEVVAPVTVRNAAARVRSRQVDVHRVPARVPRVAPAGAVRVVEVVRAPRACRDDDRDASGG